jgi:hypothetical protein
LTTWTDPTTLASNTWITDGSNIQNANSGNVQIDNAESNSGNLDEGALIFGPSDSGEGIASNRTGSENQYGLDLYTNGTSRYQSPTTDRLVSEQHHPTLSDLISLIRK